MAFYLKILFTCYQVPGKQVPHLSNEHEDWKVITNSIGAEPIKKDITQFLKDKN